MTRVPKPSLSRRDVLAGFGLAGLFAIGGSVLASKSAQAHVNSPVLDPPQVAPAQVPEAQLAELIVPEEGLDHRAEALDFSDRRRRRYWRDRRLRGRPWRRRYWRRRYRGLVCRRRWYRGRLVRVCRRVW